MHEWCTFTCRRQSSASQRLSSVGCVLGFWIFQAEFSIIAFVYGRTINVTGRQCVSWQRNGLYLEVRNRIPKSISWYIYTIPFEVTLLTHTIMHELQFLGSPAPWLPGPWIPSVFPNPFTDKPGFLHHITFSQSHVGSAFSRTATPSILVLRYFRVVVVEYVWTDLWPHPEMNRAGNLQVIAWRQIRTGPPILVIYVCVHYVQCRVSQCPFFVPNRYTTFMTAVLYLFYDRSMTVRTTVPKRETGGLSAMKCQPTAWRILCCSSLDWSVILTFRGRGLVIVFGLDFRWK